MPSVRCRIPKAAIPAVLLLALTLGVQAQWVEDSIEVPTRWVGSLCHNPTANVVYGSTSDDDSILVVDGSTHTRIGVIPLYWARFLVWDPVANRLYVSEFEDNSVAVIDCATDTVIAHIPTSPEPLRMHLSTRHRKLYVLCHGSERLNIIDLNTLEVIKNIRLSGMPEAGCYSEAADKYYCGALGNIVVLDGATDSVVAEIGLTGQALSMVAVDRHSLVLVGYKYAGSDSVHVINVDADSIVRTFPGVSAPHGLHWSEVSDLVYCTSGRWDQLVAFAGDGSRLVGTVDVGGWPFSLVGAPRFGRVYVGHLYSRQVYVIRDTVSGISETTTRPLAERPGLQASPNPFRRWVRLDCSGGEPLSGRLAIFTPDGRFVRFLPIARGSAAVWDGKDESGRRVSAGVYLAVWAERRSIAVRITKTD
jgi:YVTN family beta-propeller protein